MTTAASPATGVELTTIAVITPEKANDYGWNQQGVEGAKAAAASIGAELHRAGRRRLRRHHADHGPAGRGAARSSSSPWASGYNTAARSSRSRQDIPVTVERPRPRRPTCPARAAPWRPTARTARYLAGVLAAQHDQDRHARHRHLRGRHELAQEVGRLRRRRAQSVKPDIKILYAQIGQAAYADAAGGKRVTESAIAGGADIVFGMGDGSSFGMLQAVETATPPEGADKVWFIDVIGDKTADRQEGRAALVGAVGLRARS